MPTYATADELRAELELDVNALPDTEADRLLADAEDLVDRLLGAYTGVDTDTGRTITPSSIAAWQAAKLERATLILAKAVHADPGALTPAAGTTIEGPVFKVSGLTAGALPAAGSVAVRAAVALLDQARLRRLTARAVA